MVYIHIYQITLCRMFANMYCNDIIFYIDFLKKIVNVISVKKEIVKKSVRQIFWMSDSTFF